MGSRTLGYLVIHIPPSVLHQKRSCTVHPWVLGATCPMHAAQSNSDAHKAERKYVKIHVPVFSWTRATASFVTRYGGFWAWKVKQATHGWAGMIKKNAEQPIRTRRVEPRTASNNISVDWRNVPIPSNKPCHEGHSVHEIQPEFLPIPTSQQFRTVLDPQRKELSPFLTKQLRSEGGDATSLRK
jgi:hypothetical protein